ncbi:DUF2294 domain-containing protein [Bacillus sp. HMF5848]|uniref:DUF2294 domain-containing protein n=1 Tax=Bacillus sp. HMF5848 TaxID=2495421 RepID=UPI000F76D51E|nr:DUF2294 domain-containing protein [Bacillus sp. HMF5848]RSK27740.1 DUF2294 domain-containing protein [Bacillus sp. HMF5848]
MKKGELENNISRLLTQWEKDYLGRGSVSVKTDILRNMIIVTLKGILSPAEKTLAQTMDGMFTIKKSRSDLIESGVEELKVSVEESINTPIESFHTDISTRTGERIIVFTLKENLQDKCI